MEPVVRTPEDAFPHPAGGPYTGIGDFTTDEEVPFLGFGVFIVPPGIICTKTHGSVDVCVFLRRLIFIRFSKSSVTVKQQSQAPQNSSILGNAYFL